MSESQTQPIQIETIEHIPMMDEVHEHVESHIIPKKCITKKTYICKKNGETKIYQYDQTKYSSLYYMNNKERLSTNINCSCGGTYTILNKSNHQKSKFHKMFDNLTRTREN